jgi:TetR/AcrR family transcriptional repressor of nem operon
MRYDREHKQRTRTRVLKAAARQLRAHGPQGVGVAAVMAEAGLTHGGFYAHFPSRSAFLEAAFDQMLADSPASMLSRSPDALPADVLSRFVETYLSPRHRDARTGGCPLPLLAGDAPRLESTLERRLASSVQRMREVVATHLEQLGHPSPDDAASSCVAELIGAVILSRVERNRRDSTRLLERSRAAVLTRMGIGAGPAGEAPAQRPASARPARHAHRKEAQS